MDSQQRSGVLDHVALARYRRLLDRYPLRIVDIPVGEVAPPDKADARRAHPTPSRTRNQEPQGAMRERPGIESSAQKRSVALRSDSCCLASAAQGAQGCTGKPHPNLGAGSIG